MVNYDYIIVGAGVAGLYASLSIPEDKKVLIISKKSPWECNTFYAQGGVATAVNDDDIESHIKDTLVAGAGMCNEHAVSTMIHESQAVIKKLVELGFKFDTAPDGRLLYTKEAAHSESRILHAGGDATGRYLHQFLLSLNEHPMLQASVIDLLIEDDICYGVVTSDYKDEQKAIYGKNIIIASGGFGALYEYHTNARTISGDVQGIAIEKGLTLTDMEMTQFHPTVFVSGNSARKQLLTEALRGEGAHLVNEAGERFMLDWHKEAELAPRDIVSRAMFDESQKGKGKVYLDFSNFKESFFSERFPNIYRNLHQLGFDIPNVRVPVSPAFHYAIGGIKTDENGLVDRMKNLYAIGEVASTGVHGANRLASNSLLEGLVFSKRSIEHSLTGNNEFHAKDFQIHDTILHTKLDTEIKNELRAMMWQHVGIVRSRDGLLEVDRFISYSLAKPIGRLLRLRLLTAHAIVKAALDRKTSIGVHYILEELE
jgi:L-aspartate oxidase